MTEERAPNDRATGGDDPSISQMLAQLIHMVARNNEVTMELRNDFNRFGEDLGQLRGEVNQLSDRVEFLSNKVDHLSARVDQLEDKVDQFRNEFDQFRSEVNTKLDHIDRRLEVHRNLIGKQTEEIELLKQNR